MRAWGMARYFGRPGGQGVAVCLGSVDGVFEAFETIFEAFDEGVDVEFEVAFEIVDTFALIFEAFAHVVDAFREGAFEVVDAFVLVDDADDEGEADEDSGAPFIEHGVCGWSQRGA